MKKLTKLRKQRQLLWKKVCYFLLIEVRYFPDGLNIKSLLAYVTVLSSVHIPAKQWWLVSELVFQQCDLSTIPDLTPYVG